jgi:DNA-directed RNA polymerase alpha subunit
MIDCLELLEPEAVRMCELLVSSHNLSDEYLASIAISLKRIADYLGAKGDSITPEIGETPEVKEPDDSVEELDLSVRTANALRNGNINTISQVEQMSDQDLLRMSTNFGRKSLTELREEISKWRKGKTG